MTGIGLASVLGIGLLVTAVLLWPSGSEPTVAQGSLAENGSNSSTTFPDDRNEETAERENEEADTVEERVAETDGEDRDELAITAAVAKLRAAEDAKLAAEQKAAAEREKEVAAVGSPAAIPDLRAKFDIAVMKFVAAKGAEEKSAASKELDDAVAKLARATKAISPVNNTLLKNIPLTLEREKIVFFAFVEHQRAREKLIGTNRVQSQVRAVNQKFYKTLASNGVTPYMVPGIFAKGIKEGWHKEQ